MKALALLLGLLQFLVPAQVLASADESIVGSAGTPESSLALAGALPGNSGHAARHVRKIAWVEEWDPREQRWKRVSDTSEVPATRQRGASRKPIAIRVDRPDARTTITTRTYALGTRTAPSMRAARSAGLRSEQTARLALAHYGPFRVLDENRAAIVGSTDAASPRQFDAMLRDYPDIAQLEFVDAAGTNHDIANLAVGRRIRAAGMATHVPRNGSVRSGAVELFLAGTRRTMAQSAQFAVHSWIDNHGRQPQDFAPDAPENRLYLDYYEEMGMNAKRARAFYRMTNSVPHESARWLGSSQMRFWTTPAQQHPAPVVASAAITAEPGPASVSLPNLHDLGELSRAAPRLTIDPVLIYADSAGLVRCAA